MIVTVTVNAAIDKSYFVDRLEPGTVSRVPDIRAIPGGKGINVARVAHLLGEPVIATGFLGGHNGRFIRTELDRQGITNDFVAIEGESRVCLNIIERGSGRSTELLEQGPATGQEDWSRLRDKIRQLARGASVVAFSGSLPQGAAPDAYASLMEAARAEGARVFLDTSGDALAAGVAASPDFIKPNETEVERLLGRPLGPESELHASIRRLMEDGIGCVTVSLGAGGSLAGIGGELYRVTVPRITPVNTVGCGDSFVAGMAAAVRRGLSMEDSLRLASACGTANALTRDAGTVDPAQVEELLPQIRIDRL
ncbi:tagatose-6-phosphate kinase [Paenibacillus sp. J31TS4]|uniref:1-phosphofructokinase n=1 Tax=Paenibacillus sp. J31TS4 TaxID=2807195 RepID=UPI001B2927BA|nr:1-phosphofructokinase [Paenibacillus sp. J31TS4]GIP37996.1 tagatose-6-phosphate kinase [Paenibacillus sp. J31TS4]